MKISIESIKHSGSIDRDQLIDISSIDLKEICEIIKSNSEVISSKISDHGSFLWIEVEATNQLSSDSINLLINSSMKKFFKN